MTFPLPVLLTFDHSLPGPFPKFKPGRGNAGWTVYEFASENERAEFMRAHPESCMPSWKRLDPRINPWTGEYETL